MANIDSEIKEKLRPGYKLTKLGWIPEEWEVLPLEKLGKFFKGKGISKDEIKKGGYPCLTYGEIYTKHHDYIREFDSFIDENSAKQSTELSGGELLFAGSGETLDEIGKCVALLENIKAYAGGDIIIFKPFHSDSLFLSYLLNSNFILRSRRRLGQGHSVVHIYSSGLKTLEIPFPPLPEQQKIARILSTWDNAIETTEKLIQAKTQLKKGLMQQLLTGKRRFKEFEGEEWKNYRIEEIIQAFQNGNAFSSEGYVKDGIPIVTMAQIGLDGTFNFNKQSVNFWPSENLEKLKSFVLHKGDLIIAMTDVTPSKNLIGRMAIIDEDGPFLLNQRVGHLRLNADMVNNNFLRDLSNSRNWRKYSISVATLGVQANMSTKDILRGMVTLPSIEEQDKISKFINLFNEEIQTLQLEVKYLQKQKKILMQKLLTGEVRVIIKE
ncbi:MAG: restriction endonuclease subunit S [Bacteroidales bacterium]|nr:restriction endonuclease subunit S [Bacteroidales bacterium]